MSRGVCVFGATGSVGVNTLDVIRRHPERYHVSALSAHKNVELLYRQCQQHTPGTVVMTDAAAARQLTSKLGKGGRTRVVGGADALAELVDRHCEIVVCGIVGAAGLAPTLAAVDAGKRVLIANKEPLVMMGPQVMRRARAAGAYVLPLDSEHNAIFQCLGSSGNGAALDGAAEKSGARLHGVRKLLLTGSGGPFRQLDARRFVEVTPEQACTHPNWRMGRKISVDSATMMNKGLELIEACALFGIGEEQVEIVIHPQSTIHSMVEYIDGSVLAQLASPDMRIPIAHALAWPERIESGAPWLDLVGLGRCDFEPPDAVRFPALDLARQAIRQGGTQPAVLNAANEVAVAAFLDAQITFDRIPGLVADTMAAVPWEREIELEAVLRADAQARTVCRQRLSVAV